MKLNMEQRYKAKVRNKARDLVDFNKRYPEANALPDTRYILDDISGRYEKTCINRMKREVAREIKNLKSYGVRNSIEELEMTIVILDTRMEVLEL